MGIADITGPSVQVPFIGYFQMEQIGKGILNRLRARAFVWKADDNVIAFVSVDMGQNTDQLIMEVLKQLENDSETTGVFSIKNLMISATHTHSDPGGYQSNVYQFQAFSFVQQSFDTYVSGTFQAIKRAYGNLAPATTKLAMGTLLHTNLNRSPLAYLLNPQDERDNYTQGNTDKRFLQLNIEKNGNPAGIVNWFAVHANSLNFTNKLVSSDNKGYAAYHVERQLNGIGEAPGTGPFVASFASSNLGDTSSRTEGGACHYWPETPPPGAPTECEPDTSTCPNNWGIETPMACTGLGPGKDMYESCAILGKRQADKALELMESDEQVEMTGPIDSRHSFVKFPELPVKSYDGKDVNLCWPAWGLSLPAGTIDGPGLPVVEQAESEITLSTHHRFRWILSQIVAEADSFLLGKPSQADIDCQAPKPFLLHFDKDLTKPFQWYPSKIPIQIFRVGCLFILACPGEFTTMAGRRLRNATEHVLTANLPQGQCDKVYTTIAGLANSYIGYVTTFQEYQAQRYEGASCAFGPNTLQGYIQEFSRLAKDIATNQETATEAGPEPRIVEEHLRFIPPPQLDKCPESSENPTSCFGEVIQEPYNEYCYGDTVLVRFQAANPRHNLRLDDTYLTLERSDGEVVLRDGDWMTRFAWEAQGRKMKLSVGECAETPADMGKLVTEGAKIVTQGLNKGVVGGKNAIKILNAINVSKPLEILDFLCLSGEKASEGIANLTVILPSEKDKDLYSLTEGELMLCYHGNYKVESDKGAVAFKSCSRTFKVVENNCPKIRTVATGHAGRWVSSIVIAIAGLVFVSYV